MLILVGRLILMGMIRRGCMGRLRELGGLAWTIGGSCRIGIIVPKLMCIIVGSSKLRPRTTKIMIGK